MEVSSVYLRHLYEYPGDLTRVTTPSYLSHLCDSTSSIRTDPDDYIKISDTGKIEIALYPCICEFTDPESTCDLCDGTRSLVFEPQRLLDLGFRKTDCHMITCDLGKSRFSIRISQRMLDGLQIEYLYNGETLGDIQYFPLPIFLRRNRQTHPSTQYHQSDIISDLLTYQLYYDVVVDSVLQNMSMLSLGCGHEDHYSRMVDLRIDKYSVEIAYTCLSHVKSDVRDIRLYFDSLLRLNLPLYDLYLTLRWGRRSKDREISISTETAISFYGYLLREDVNGHHRHLINHVKDTLLRLR